MRLFQNLGITLRLFPYLKGNEKEKPQRHRFSRYSVWKVTYFYLTIYFQGIFDGKLQNKGYILYNFVCKLQFFYIDNNCL